MNQRTKVALVLVGSIIVSLSGFGIAKAVPTVNILGHYAVVGTGLTATTTANANFTASGTIAFVNLASAGSPCLVIGTMGLIATSTCGGGSFTTTTINSLSATVYTITTSTDTNLGIIMTPTAPGTLNFLPVWIGTLADGRIASAATWNAKQNALSFPLAYASTTHISFPIPYASTTGFSFNGSTHLTVSSSSGAWTFTNSGVQSFNNATGSITYNPWPVSYASTTGFTFTGSTYLTIASSSGAWTFTNSGVQSLSATSPLQVSSATGTPSISFINPSVQGQLIMASGTTQAVWGNLVAGSNITLTTSTPGQITIASTGGGSGGPATSSIPFIIEYPTISENDAIFIFNSASTIRACSAVNKTVGDTATFGLGYSTNRQTATSSLFNVFTSSPVTVTATTTPTTLSLASTTPAAGSALIFYSTSASTTQLTLTCDITIP